jgi:hypothetical protein
MMKLRVDEFAWLALVVSLFCFLSLYVRGPEPRVANDYLSDISLMRFQQGDWSSLIVTNRSPVLAFSIPYGAWPPLHTMMQALWSLFGMKLEYARFMTGMMASLSFALLTLLVLRKLIQTDAVMVVSAALISPIVIFFVWHGMTHVLIPCSIMAGLWLVVHNIERDKCFWGMNFVVGFVLGLTDWFTYGLIPALFIAIAIEKVFYNKDRIIKRNLLYQIVLSLSLGFAIAFVSYKISEYLILNSSNIIFFKEGLTISKLYHRIFPNMSTLMYAVFFTVVRFFIVFIPILLINRIAGGYTLKHAIQEMPFKFRFILLVALLAPFCFAAIFPVQVHPANHRMQTLSFLPSATLLLGFLISKTSVNHLRKSISIALLTLVAVYGISGYLIVPDQWLIKDTFPDLVHPLPIGDYDLSIDRPAISMTKILKTINNQMMTYPCCDERLVKLNAFHQSWNDIKQYGELIRQNTQPDEMIVYFGGFTPGFSYYTQRVENRVSHTKYFNHLMSKYSQKVKIALLVPEKSSIKKLHEIDTFSKHIIHTKTINGTPYKLLRFKMEENDGL